jgi:hypothetical protein
VSKYSYKRVSKTFIEVVGETLGTPPILLFNKLIMRKGRRRYINVGEGAYIYVYTKDKDKTQTATITDYVSISNPTADRDWNDGTRAERSTPAGTTEDIRLYDYGVNKERYIYFNVYGPAVADNYIALAISEDGVTWIDIYRSTGGGAGLVRRTFRYIKWYCINNTAYARTTGINTLEVFDTDDYTLRLEKTYNLDIYDDLVWIIIDGSNPVYYYVYDISDVKETVSEGLLEV